MAPFAHREKSEAEPAPHPIPALAPSTDATDPAPPPPSTGSPRLGPDPLYGRVARLVASAFPPCT